MNVDRQTIMMVTNLLVGALGGLALAFQLNAALTTNVAAGGMVMCAVGFAIVALFLQMSRLTRVLGAVVAFAFFSGGVITAYILVQEVNPGLLPERFTDEVAQYAVRMMIALVGVLVAILWWVVNPHSPVPPISLKFAR